MKKYIIYMLAITLPGFSISSYAADAPPADSPLVSAAFVPSDFMQKTATTISTIESSIDSFLKNKEIDDLNFGLHIINFDSSPIQNPQQQFITDFSRIYCNPAYESSLPECNQENKNNTGRIYANLRPSNMFDLTYSDTDLLLAKTLVRNLVEPFPSTEINTMLANASDAKDTDKQATLANLIAPQAALMLATNSLNEIMARRQTHENNPKSIMQMMHDESARRLTDPTWIKGIGKLPTDQLLMELLQVEAFKLWMEYNKFTQNERIEALLATLLSSQISTGAKMGQQLDKATAGGTKAAAEASKNLPTLPSGQ